MTTFARRAERVQPSAIREFLALAGDPRITSFAGGYPDPTLFPMDELHGIYADLLSAGNASALQYTASDGLPELRALVAARLTADGMPCTADDVLITQGGQQGLDLTAKLFIDRGRRHRHRAADLPRCAHRLQPVRARLPLGADGRGGHGHRRPRGGAAQHRAGQARLHRSRLPEPDRVAR